MILYNSENSIYDIRLFCFALFHITAVFEVYSISVVNP